MPRKRKDTLRKQRYRERVRQQQAPAPVDPARLDAIRRLVRQDVPEDMLLDYIRVSDLLTAELARTPQRTRAINELSTTKMRIGEALGVTPREQRLGGQQSEESIGTALARSAANVERLRAAEWVNLRQEVAVFGRKTVGDRAVFEEDLIIQIGDLKRHRPELFSETEMAATSRELFDAILATAPERPPETPVAMPSDVPAEAEDTR